MARKTRPGLWVRIHDAIYDDDKVLALIEDNPTTGLEAAAVFAFGIAWSKRNRKDGHIPKGALSRIHGKPKHATALVRVGLWQQSADGGWNIPAFNQWQDSSEEIDRARQSRAAAGRKSMCQRWHDQPCSKPECEQPTDNVWTLPLPAEEAW